MELGKHFNWVIRCLGRIVDVQFVNHSQNTTEQHAGLYFMAGCATGDSVENRAIVLLRHGKLEDELDHKWLEYEGRKTTAKL